MLEGKAIFAGVKEFMSKKGNLCRVAKLISSETGDYAEIFIHDTCRVATGIKLMSEVKVKVDWASIGGRASFSVMEISPGGM